MNPNEIYAGYHIPYIDYESIYPRIITKGVIAARLPLDYFIIDGKTRHISELYGDDIDMLFALEDIIEKRMDELSELLITTRSKLRRRLP